MQLTLGGESIENKAIDEEISRYKESLDELIWVLNKSKWTDNEKAEWWLRNGGDIEYEDQHFTKSMEFMKEEIADLESAKITKEF